MKPPFVRITADCTRHGRFQVERKPNKHAPTGGAETTGFYQAVTCPKCRLWGEIVQQEMVLEIDAPPVLQQLEMEVCR